MIRVGTSGFQYPEWRGGFYPEKLSTAKMLGYYSRQFATTEVNYTFRQIPSAKTLARWIEETPPAFAFSLKAPQAITHFAKLKDCESKLSYFFEVVSGLGAKRGAILFQLPPAFAVDLERLTAFLKLAPAGLRPAFEFRHPSWFEENVLAALREHGAALCVAETEDLATPATVTSAALGYFRLRRLDYTEADLQRWADVVAGAGTRETCVYFKHEETGAGPRFAARFVEMLRARGAILP